MRVRNMTEGNPLRLILAVAFPLMLGNVFQQLYTVVDAQIVGSVVGVSALAALGAADWFNWLFIGIAQGFAQGFAILCAGLGRRKIGAFQMNASDRRQLLLCLLYYTNALFQHFKVC